MNRWTKSLQGKCCINQFKSGRDNRTAILPPQLRSCFVAQSGAFWSIFICTTGSYTCSWSTSLRGRMRPVHQIILACATERRGRGRCAYKDSMPALLRGSCRGIFISIVFWIPQTVAQLKNGEVQQTNSISLKTKNNATTRHQIEFKADGQHIAQIHISIRHVWGWMYMVIIKWWKKEKGIRKRPSIINHETVAFG